MKYLWTIRSNFGVAMFEILDFSCTLFRYVYVWSISAPLFTFLAPAVPYLPTSHLKPTNFLIAAEIFEFQSPGNSVISTKILHLSPRNLAFPPYCHYLPSEGKICFGRGGVVGGLQRHNVHTKFRRNWSPLSEVETGRRGKLSRSYKTYSLLSLEFPLQGLDGG